MFQIFPKKMQRSPVKPETLLDNIQTVTFWPLNEIVETTGTDYLHKDTLAERLIVRLSCLFGREQRTGLVFVGRK